MATESKQIEKVMAREILDSRGNPTVEVEVSLVDGVKERVLELRKVAGHGSIGIGPVSGNGTDARLAVRRRLTGQNMIKRRAQRIEV